MADKSNKTIAVTVRFWNSFRDGQKGTVVPKRCLTSGTVYLPANAVHGIRRSPSVRFKSLMELPAAIEKLLKREGVRLRLSQKMRTYVHEEAE